MLTGAQTLENINALFGAYLEKEPSSFLLWYILDAPLKMGFNLLISKYLILFYPTYRNYDSINDVEVHLPTFGTLGFLNLPQDANAKPDTEVNYFHLLKAT